jgi:hypothetical protein
MIIWGQAPMMPLAVETWRVIFGCAKQTLLNMTLLTGIFYHRLRKKASAPSTLQVRQADPLAQNGPETVSWVWAG